jgi:hypothetical protein
MHWRFHFREPRSKRERLLRSHHLAHHFCNSRVYHGVSTRLWIGSSGPARRGGKRTMRESKTALRSRARATSSKSGIPG